MESITSIFETMGVPEEPHIDQMDRMGRQIGYRHRPVIVRFPKKSDRDRVWACRRKLKGTQFIVHEDLPDDYITARKHLMP